MKVKKLINLKKEKINMATKKKDFIEISSKNTKDQILSAYKEVIECLEEAQIESPQEEKKKSDEREVIHKSSQTSLEGIVSHLASLKITLTKNIDGLSENLVREFDKLSELKQAIEIEQKHLYELYEIKEAAHTLSALMLIHKEETEKFELKIKEERFECERELEDKKYLWNKKQDELEAQYIELKEKLEKQHKREEEEYIYNLEVFRRLELQEHILKKEAIEKEFEERSQVLAQKEDFVESRIEEIEKLKQKVEGFPEELLKETKKTIQEVTQKLEDQHKFAVSLKEKEIQGEKNLYLQKIASLETKVKEQSILIVQLTQKADDSINQVQEIACKALEASSLRLPYASYGEKGQENFQSRQEKQVA